jgi:hypothetical protein
MKIEVEVFWVVIPCSVEVGTCLHLQDEVKMNAVGYPAAALHGIITQKTSSSVSQSVSQSVFVYYRVVFDWPKAGYTPLISRG